MSDRGRAMRLFAAVYPPPHEVERLTAVIGDLPEVVRPVPPRQWHLTTAFYGDVPERAVDVLTERLRRGCARTSPFSLSLGSAGTFPADAGRAEVLWLRVLGDVEPLSRLAERCTAAGRRCGLRMSERRYRPHLTLGRARRGTADLTAIVERLSAAAAEPWPVEQLHLVRSTLGATVRHETLVTIPLAAPAEESTARQ